MLSRLFGKDNSKKPGGAPLPNVESMASQASQSDLASFDRFGVTIIATLKERTLSGNEAAALVVALTDRLTEPGQMPARHVVLDLQNVEYMDSACIGVLVELLTRLQKAGGRVALVNTAANVECLFKLTRLDRLFPICRDVMRAIEAVERQVA
ncbi:MAG: STAS domain-containing protein [Phycisphaeraceae bacterium]|nr:STAS domain-containing protein [Phycisphaeraceae bacterium]